MSVSVFRNGLALGVPHAEEPAPGVGAVRRVVVRAQAAPDRLLPVHRGRQKVDLHFGRHVGGRQGDLVLGVAELLAVGGRPVREERVSLASDPDVLLAFHGVLRQVLVHVDAEQAGPVGAVRSDDVEVLDVPVEPVGGLLLVRLVPAVDRVGEPAGDAAAQLLGEPLLGGPVAPPVGEPVCEVRPHAAGVAVAVVVELPVAYQDVAAGAHLLAPAVLRFVPVFLLMFPPCLEEVLEAVLRLAGAFLDGDLVRPAEDSMSTSSPP